MPVQGRLPRFSWSQGGIWHGVDQPSINNQPPAITSIARDRPLAVNRTIALAIVQHDALCYIDSEAAFDEVDLQ